MKSSILKRASFLATLTFISTITSLTGASAHTVLVASSPSRDSIQAVSPREISLRFAEALLTLSGHEINRIYLFDPSHKAIKLGKSTVKSTILSATILSRSLINGLYLVKYRVTADDGHVVNGSYTFTLKN